MHSVTLTSVPIDRHPRRNSILRHIRSASNVRRGTRGESAEAIVEDLSGGGVKKRMGLVKEVSGHADRSVRGLDSALDFVDGHVGSSVV